MAPDDRWLAAVWPFVREQLPAGPAGVLEVGCGTLGGLVPALQDLPSPAGKLVVAVPSVSVGGRQPADNDDGWSARSAARSNDLGTGKG